MAGKGAGPEDDMGRIAPWACGISLTIGWTGCADDDWQALQGAPPDVLEQPTSGTYEGWMEVQMRAYGGPVRVAREHCSVPFVASVDPVEVDWFVGEGPGCDLGPRAGEVDFTFVPPAGTAYEGAIDGRLDGLGGRWDGWFHGDDALYMEAAGERDEGAGRLAWVVFVDAVRVARP